MERSHLHCYQFVTVSDSVCSVKANEIPHIKRVLPDSHKNWEITSQDLGLKSAKAFSVRLRTLHGGRQEGVCIVDIDTGVMKISVIPTRGMNVVEAVVGNVRIGWRSPVSEVVNPAFIELNGVAAWVG